SSGGVLVVSMPPRECVCDGRRRFLRDRYPGGVVDVFVLIVVLVLAGFVLVVGVLGLEFRVGGVVFGPDLGPRLGLLVGRGQRSGVLVAYLAIQILGLGLLDRHCGCDSHGLA